MMGEPAQRPAEASGMGHAEAGGAGQDGAAELHGVSGSVEELTTH